MPGLSDNALLVGVDVEILALRVCLVRSGKERGHAARPYAQTLQVRGRVVGRGACWTMVTFEKMDAETSRQSPGRPCLDFRAMLVVHNVYRPALVYLGREGLWAALCGSTTGVQRSLYGRSWKSLK